jgi:hypothetical protein
MTVGVTTPLIVIMGKRRKCRKSRRSMVAASLNA